VTIAPAILEHYPDLNDSQREVVSHMDGPMLVVAGPGSGKTYSIVLRALNLLLLNRAGPVSERRPRRRLSHAREWSYVPGPIRTASQTVGQVAWLTSSAREKLMEEPG